MSSIPQTLALSVSQLVDSLAGGRVVVLGSPPPHGRDLDLLVRAPERARTEQGLLANGHVERGGTFARFAECSAYGVELIAAERYLPPGPLEDLFREARTLSPFVHLAEPAPRHALLILARLVAEEGQLAAKRRRRLERIQAAAPAVWEDAQRIAPAWGAEGALRLLGELARDPAPRPVSVRAAASGDGRRRAAPAARAALALARGQRGMLVSLSGLDGSGKSSQARWLVESLQELGVPAEVVWNDLHGNIAGDVVARPLKALLGLLGRRPREFSSHAAPPAAELLADADAGRTGSSQLVREAWSAYVTLTDALEQRWHAARHQARGRVVVFDRGPLDLAVRMEVLYRTSKARQTSIARLATPRPALSFLLEIPPELSLERKDDIWSLAQLTEQAGIYSSLADRFRVTRLDGTRPAAELAAEITTKVWRALG